MASVAVTQQNSVRKHRAPKGALRPRIPLNPSMMRVMSQKAPSAKRRIKTTKRISPSTALRQKAPSAKRCIKTPRGCTRTRSAHRRQKAPSAKRCIKTVGDWRRGGGLASRQKAPSAKRCIKTYKGGTVLFVAFVVRKHRAPKGALRLSFAFFADNGVALSESTERQKGLFRVECG